MNAKPIFEFEDLVDLKETGVLARFAMNKRLEMLKKQDLTEYINQVNAMLTLNQDQPINSMISLTDFAKAIHIHTNSHIQIQEIQTKPVDGEQCKCSESCKLTIHDAQIHAELVYRILQEHEALQKSAENFVGLYTLTSNCMRQADAYASFVFENFKAVKEADRKLQADKEKIKMQKQAIIQKAKFAALGTKKKKGQKHRNIKDFIQPNEEHSEEIEINEQSTKDNVNSVLQIQEKDSYVFIDLSLYTPYDKEDKDGFTNRCRNTFEFPTITLKPKNTFTEVLYDILTERVQSSIKQAKRLKSIVQNRIPGCMEQLILNIVQQLTTRFKKNLRDLCDTIYTKCFDFPLRRISLNTLQKIKLVRIQALQIFDEISMQTDYKYIENDTSKKFHTIDSSVSKILTKINKYKGEIGGLYTAVISYWKNCDILVKSTQLDQNFLSKLDELNTIDAELSSLNNQGSKKRELKEKYKNTFAYTEQIYTKVQQQMTIGCSMHEENHQCENTTIWLIGELAKTRKGLPVACKRLIKILDSPIVSLDDDEQHKPNQVEQKLTGTQLEHFRKICKECNFN